MGYWTFEHALITASEQEVNHQRQVPGCWSINGKSFCEKHGLDYEDARDYEREQLTRDYGDYVFEQQVIIERRIGKMSEKQKEKLHEWCVGELDEEEGAYFWTRVKSQLVSHHPVEYARYLGESKLD